MLGLAPISRDCTAISLGQSLRKIDEECNDTTACGKPTPTSTPLICWPSLAQIRPALAMFTPRANEVAVLFQKLGLILFSLAGIGNLGSLKLRLQALGEDGVDGVHGPRWFGPRLGGCKGLESQGSRGWSKYVRTTYPVPLRFYVGKSIRPKPRQWPPFPLSWGHDIFI